MAKFSQSNPPPRVLLLSPTTGAVDKTRFNYKACTGLFNSLGCYVADYNEADMTAGDQVFQDDWDLVCVPNINDASDYVSLAATLALFDNTPPCYVANALSTSASGAARVVTGILTVNAATVLTQATALENWQGRQSGQVSFYGKPAVTWESDITIHAQDASNEVSLFSRTYNGSNMLYQIGGVSSTQTLAKPWIGAQWMVDQASEARATQLKAHLNKRHCKLRIDNLSNANAQAAYTAGDLDTIYNALVSYGIKEVWVGDIWGSTTSADTLALSETDVLDWFKARSETSVGSGGIFRHMNHEIDVYNGTNTYDTFGENCSSDGAAIDQFKAASYCYKWGCDQLTDYGFILGTDGYGAGYPSLMDGNDMGIASAKFLCSTDSVYDTDGFYGGFATHPMISGDETYPTNEAVKVSLNHSYKWHDGYTSIWYSQDTTNEAAFNIVTDFGADIARSLIIGGGIYYHAQTGGGTERLATYISEYCQLLTAYPSVISNSYFEEMLVDLKRGTGIWFDG